MRTAITSSLCIAAVLGIAIASPENAAAETVSFTNLPVVPATAKTDQPAAPDKIPATEHAEGMYAALTPAAKRKQAEEDGYRYIWVFANEKEAQTFASDGTAPSVQPQGATRQCLTAGSSLAPRLTLYLRTKPYVPKPSKEEIVRLTKLHRWPPPPPPKPSKAEAQKDTVELIHSEKLVQSADAVTLDTVDAYIDLQTLGTRQLSKSSVRLTKVATGPNGLGVFAARDDKGQSQFLVTNPELPQPATPEDRDAQVQQLQGTANRLVAQMPTGSASETGCGYVRFTLTAKPGSGQMATVLATAFLPPADDPDDAAPDESQFDSESLTDEQRKMIHEMIRRQNRAQRARPVAINVSFSQLASESNPLLSVTMGWAGPDQRLRF